MILKNSYSSNFSYFALVNADHEITKDIIREPKLLGRWFSYSDKPEVVKDIQRNKEAGGLSHILLYEFLNRDYQVRVQYLKDRTVESPQEKYHLVKIARHLLMILD